MLMNTNGIRAFGAVDDFHYAQVAGTSEGQWFSVAITYDDGEPFYHFPLQMGELVVKNVHWIKSN